MSHDDIYEQQSVHLVISHLIWCPKRCQMMVGPVRDYLQAIIGQVAAEHDWQIITLSLQPDHVHLFIGRNPSPLPTDMAPLLKRRCAHDLQEAFLHLKRMPKLETRSTFYSTAGNVSSEMIEQSIARQSTE